MASEKDEIALLNLNKENNKKIQALGEPLKGNVIRAIQSLQAGRVDNLIEAKISAGSGSLFTGFVAGMMNRFSALFWPTEAALRAELEVLQPLLNGEVQLIGAYSHTVGIDNEFQNLQIDLNQRLKESIDNYRSSLFPRMLANDNSNLRNKFLGILIDILGNILGDNVELNERHRSVQKMSDLKKELLDTAPTAYHDVKAIFSKVCILNPFFNDEFNSTCFDDDLKGKRPGAYPFNTSWLIPTFIIDTLSYFFNSYVGFFYSKVNERSFSFEDTMSNCRDLLNQLKENKPDYDTSGTQEFYKQIEDTKEMLDLVEHNVNWYTLCEKMKDNAQFENYIAQHKNTPEAKMYGVYLVISKLKISQPEYYLTGLENELNEINFTDNNSNKDHLDKIDKIVKNLKDLQLSKAVAALKTALGASHQVQFKKELENYFDAHYKHGRGPIQDTSENNYPHGPP